MQRKSYLVRCAAIALGVAGSFLTTALGDWTEMASRLPADTNAFVAFNVEAILKTPMAEKQGWAEKWSNSYESGLVAVPPGTQRILAGSMLANSLREANWRITQVEGKQPIELQDIARGEGGYVEKVWDKMAVVTSDYYFISLSKTSIASVTPPDHQRISRWLRTPTTNEKMGLSSPRLKALLGALGVRSHVLMALDVENSRTATEVRRSIDAAPIPNLDKSVDLDLLANTIANIKTISMAVNVTDKFTTELSIEFSSDPKWVTPHVKPVATEFIGRVGLDLPEIDQWTIATEGNVIRMTGEMSPESMANVLSTVGIRTVKPAEPITDDPKVIAQNSRKFYRTIVAGLESFPRPASYPKAITWTGRQSEIISRMPVINVDPALVAWSQDISQRLRNIQGGLAADQASNQSEQAKVQQNRRSGGYGYGNGAYSGYYGNDGSYAGWGYYGPQGAAIQNQKRADAERAQVMRDSQAKSVRNITTMMDGIVERRDALRIEMTKKYGIEF